MGVCVWRERMNWAEAAPRGNHRKGMVLPRQAATLPFRLDGSPGGSAILG
jgi:hypothetical protein